jgi:hypothetical protein
MKNLVKTILAKYKYFLANVGALIVLVPCIWISDKLTCACDAIPEMIGLAEFLRSTAENLTGWGLLGFLAMFIAMAANLVFTTAKAIKTKTSFDGVVNARVDKITSKFDSIKSVINTEAITTDTTTDTTTDN